MLPIFKKPESREPWVGRDAESKHIPHLQDSWKKMPPATEVTAPLPTWVCQLIHRAPGAILLLLLLEAAARFTLRFAL